MAAVTGAWGDVFDTTIIGIHQVLLADGRVLYWGGDGNGNAFSNTQKYGIYDPATGEHEILPDEDASQMGRISIRTTLNCMRAIISKLKRFLTNCLQSVNERIDGTVSNTLDFIIITRD